MPSFVSTRSIRPRTRRPSAISTGSLALAHAEPQLEVLGLELAVGLGLAAQPAQQVELEPAGGRPHARLLRRDREHRLALAQLLQQDPLRPAQVARRHAAVAGLLAQAPVGVLEHRVGVVAAHHRLGVGRELLRPQQVLDQPLDRAVGEALERSRGDRLPRRQPLEQGLRAQRARDGLLPAGCPRRPAPARARRPWARPRAAR